MTKKPKPYGSLGLSGEMPRQKSEDMQKTEKILREEQDRERNALRYETYDQVLQRQAREEQERDKPKPLK